ncbi:MAG: hypothetical protein U0521_09355 [Anaerolineae bacterium]
MVKLVGAAGDKPVAAAPPGTLTGITATSTWATSSTTSAAKAIPDAGRGKYAKDYFRQGRYASIFNNAYGHNIPVIGGHTEQPGPEFGGRKQYRRDRRGAARRRRNSPSWTSTPPTIFPN